MVTLHVAKWLEQQGFGTIDSDIFWEEIPIADGKAAQGLWVVSRGAPLNRFNSYTQQFDVYSRYQNKITGSVKLEQILEKIKEVYGDVCTLPEVPPYSYNQYVNVRLRPVSGIENVGTDDQDMIVRVISAEVQYNLVKE